MSFHITIRHITLNHHQCWDMFRACIPVLAFFFSRNHFIGSDPKNCCGCDYQLPGVYCNGTSPQTNGHFNTLSMGKSLRWWVFLQTMNIIDRRLGMLGWFLK